MTIRIHHHPDKTDSLDLDEIRGLVATWRRAVDGDSGDAESESAADLIDTLLGVVGVDYEEVDPEEERSQAELAVQANECVYAVLDIAALLGGNHRWDADMLEMIAGIVGKITTNANLPPINTSDPAALGYWRAQARVRDIITDGE